MDDQNLQQTQGTKTQKPTPLIQGKNTYTLKPWICSGTPPPPQLTARTWKMMVWNEDDFPLQNGSMLIFPGVAFIFGGVCIHIKGGVRRNKAMTDQWEDFSYLPIHEWLSYMAN